MGYGNYSVADQNSRSVSKGYANKSVEQIFTQRKIHHEMDPTGVKIREARDSEDHPNSIAIVLALDVTGSMGVIPHQLVQEGLPTIMGSIIEAGNPDPQLLFLAIGDHKCDDAPLQVAQFEANDALLDHWLTSVWVEEGGGGNGGESYGLAHYFAAYHTSIDCFEKRGQKGFLFTIGDEHNHKSYPASAIKKIMGSSEASTFTSADLIAKAKEMYNVYHLFVGYSSDVYNGWAEVLGENCIKIANISDIPKTIARIVFENTKAAGTPVAITEPHPYGSTPENPILGPSKDNPPTQML